MFLFQYDQLRFVVLQAKLQKLGKSFFDDEFVILESCAHPVLIGLGWLRDKGVIIDCEKNTPKIKGGVCKPANSPLKEKKILYLIYF